MNGLVEYDGFQRGILLTALQGDGLLGSMEFDYFLHNAELFFRTASFRRIFRSIGVISEKGAAIAEEEETGSILSDTIGALIVVTPQFFNCCPSTEQLKVAARRLLAEEPTPTQRKLRRADISTLVDLLLRIKLKEKKWEKFFHSGDIAIASLADQELTEALVNRLAGDESEKSLTPDQLLQAMDAMVSAKYICYEYYTAVTFTDTFTAQPAHEILSTVGNFMATFNVTHSPVRSI